MEAQEKNTNTTADQKHEHISSYKEHVGTWVALVLLTLMTFAVSVYGANLRTITVATALLIATVKGLTVAMYFMHLKYEPKIFRGWIFVVLFLFVFFLAMTILDYLTR
jgi:cytochrome c oxidase subunit 4